MKIDPDRFREVVETHQSMVYSIALRLTGDPGAAEEVAQDAFLELYKWSDRFESDDHVRFWLRRVTVHRATDHLRRKARQPERGAEEWMEDQHGSVVERYADAGVIARLEEILRTLPEAMRVVVVLRYQEEMMPEEIGRLLRQPVATVKSNLRRGLELMRRKAEVTMKEYVR